jgi:hypothetical protein
LRVVLSQGGEESRGVYVCADKGELTTRFRFKGGGSCKVHVRRPPQNSCSRTSCTIHSAKWRPGGECTATIGWLCSINGPEEKAPWVVHAATQRVTNRPVASDHGSEPTMVVHVYVPLLQYQYRCQQNRRYRGGTALRCYCNIAIAAQGRTCMTSHTCSGAAAAAERGIPCYRYVHVYVLRYGIPVLHNMVIACRWCVGTVCTYGRCTYQ